jgi:PPOX class probable F420-dependent enzyme
MDEHRYASLATRRRSGVVVRTPVWFAEAGGRFYVFTAGESGKVKRVRHTPGVQLAPCDARGAIRGPWRDGTARLLHDRAATGAAHAALLAKYGWQMRVLDLFSWLTGRIGRRAWIEIMLDPNGGPSTHVRPAS